VQLSKVSVSELEYVLQRFAHLEVQDWHVWQQVAQQ
jgi:hypothetical protein